MHCLTKHSNVWDTCLSMKNMIKLKNYVYQLISKQRMLRRRTEDFKGHKFCSLYFQDEIGGQPNLARERNVNFRAI